MQDGEGKGGKCNKSTQYLFRENMDKQLSLQVTAQELHAERKKKLNKKTSIKQKQPNIKIKKCLHDLDTAEEHNTE